MNRQIGVENFIRVVILDPPTKGHVTQRMRNPKIAILRYCTAKRLSYDSASFSETTTPIDKKFHDNIRTTKMCPAMQYCDVITYPRWRTAAILKISEKSSDFDQIWYTTADIEPNDSHVINNCIFKNSRWRRPPS